MSETLAESVLTVSDDLPLRVARPVHSGKVRSVYFLEDQDSRRLIQERGYAIAPDSQLAIMVISDRLSAFDCLWRSETLAGVPGKGAALNAIAAHWFAQLQGAGGLSHHLLEMPHPLLWIVRQARPVMIEAIARRYLTGSLWRAYQTGLREFAGKSLADGMPRYARLDELLFTPSTKGVMRGIPGVLAVDDAPLSRAALSANLSRFGLRTQADAEACETALLKGFERIEAELSASGQLLVDTKFEFGFAPALGGGEELIYMDEVGTPDSSRIWDRADWDAGTPREHSKEQFREALLAWTPDPQVLLDATRMEERMRFAQEHCVPDPFFLELGETYTRQAERITGHVAQTTAHAREALLDVLSERFGLVS